MAARLIKKKLTINAFVSSPAARAKKTAELFAKAYNLLPDEIVFISSLYHAPVSVFYEVIKTLPDEQDTIALFSHNPGITYFVNELVPNVRIDNMPTCGIFAISINTNHWKDFTKSQKKLLFFDWPRNI
jgi:phosphohistidine phosphatase